MIKNTKSIEISKKIKYQNKRLKDKLRDIEDQWRRNNLRFDRLQAYESESWNDTEEVLKYFLFENLGLTNIKMERTHRTREKNKTKIHQEQLNQNSVAITLKKR